MSYCVKCGVKLSPGSKSCPLCGTAVISPEEQETAVPTFPRNPKSPPGQRIRRSTVALLLELLLILPPAVCLICDFVPDRSLGWSYIVLASILPSVLFFLGFFRSRRFPCFSLRVYGRKLVLGIFAAGFTSCGGGGLYRLGRSDQNKNFRPSVCGAGSDRNRFFLPGIGNFAEPGLSFSQHAGLVALSSGCAVCHWRYPDRDRPGSGTEGEISQKIFYLKKTDEACRVFVRFYVMIRVRRFPRRLRISLAIVPHWAAISQAVISASPDRPISMAVSPGLISGISVTSTIV